MGLWQIFNVLSLGANILKCYRYGADWCMYGTPLCVRQCSDPHHSDADPDPVLTFYFDTHPYPVCHFDADRDMDSTGFHFDADLDPHPIASQ
jgi:hypothetical protein